MPPGDKNTVEVKADIRELITDRDSGATTIQLTANSANIKKRSFESALSLLSRKRVKQSQALKVASKDQTDVTLAPKASLSNLPCIQDQVRREEKRVHSLKRIPWDKPKSLCSPCIDEENDEEVKSQHFAFSVSKTETGCTQNCHEVNGIQEPTEVEGTFMLQQSNTTSPGFFHKLPPPVPADPLKCLDHTRIMVLELVKERLGIETLEKEGTATGNLTNLSSERLQDHNEDKQHMYFKFPRGLHSSALCIPSPNLEGHQEKEHLQVQQDTASVSVLSQSSSPIFADLDCSIHPGTSSRSQPPFQCRLWAAELWGGSPLLHETPAVRHQAMRTRELKESNEHEESNLFRGEGVISSLLADEVHSTTSLHGYDTWRKPGHDNFWGQDAENMEQGYSLVESLVDQEDRDYGVGCSGVDLPDIVEGSPCAQQ